MVITYGWATTKVTVVIACLFLAFHLLPDDPTIVLPDVAPQGAVDPESIVEIVGETEQYKTFDRTRILTSIEVTYFPRGHPRHARLEQEYGVSHHMIYRADVISLTRCFGATTRTFFMDPDGALLGVKESTKC